VTRPTGIALLAIACATACTGAAVRATLPVEREILFTRQAPGTTEDLWAIDPASGRERLVIPGDSLSSRSQAVWSPSGRAIAYVREFGDHDELYVLDSASAVPRRLGAGVLRPIVLFPDWSPDGRSLLVTSGDSLKTQRVFLVPVNGDAVRELPGGAGEYRCASWAPNGRDFATGVYAAGRSTIWSVEVLDGSPDVIVASDTSYLDCPQWAPMGSSILVTEYTTGGRSLYDLSLRDILTARLAVVDVYSGAKRTVVAGPGMNNYGRWSRDGQWIVFQSDRAAPPAPGPDAGQRRFNALEIWIVGRDGSALRRLTRNENFDAHPSW
jgi:Tol biopolymer transport system component